MNGLWVFFCIFVCAVFLRGSEGHPMFYRYNEDKNLEPALIAVSSTVIPLAAYDVGYGINVKGGPKKGEFPSETLITVKTKKRIIEKEKYKEKSTV